MIHEVIQCNISLYASIRQSKKLINQDSDLDSAAVRYGAILGESYIMTMTSVKYYWEA